MIYDFNFGEQKLMEIYCIVMAHHLKPIFWSAKTSALKTLLVFNTAKFIRKFYVIFLAAGAQGVHPPNTGNGNDENEDPNQN